MPDGFGESISLAHLFEKHGTVVDKLRYPFSVVMGGVSSPEEASLAAAEDPQVASHYQDVSLPELRPTTVVSARLVHVSYRKEGLIWWTRKKVRLAPGEVLLTDGAHEIRGRCGNRISEAAQSPTRPDEPSEAAFNTPAVPRLPGYRLNPEPLPSEVRATLDGVLAPGFLGDPSPVSAYTYFQPDPAAFASRPGVGVHYPITSGVLPLLPSLPVRPDTLPPDPSFNQPSRPPTGPTQPPNTDTQLPSVDPGDPPLDERLDPPVIIAPEGPGIGPEPGNPDGPSDAGDPRDPRDPGDPGSPNQPGKPDDPKRPEDPDKPFGPDDPRQPPTPPGGPDTPEVPEPAGWLLSLSGVIAIAALRYRSR